MSFDTNVKNVLSCMQEEKLGRVAKNITDKVQEFVN